MREWSSYLTGEASEQSSRWTVTNTVSSSAWLLEITPSSSCSQPCSLRGSAQFVSKSHRQQDWLEPSLTWSWVAWDVTNSTLLGFTQTYCLSNLWKLHAFPTKSCLILGIKLWLGVVVVGWGDREGEGVWAKGAWTEEKLPIISIYLYDTVFFNFQECKRRISDRS